jgi:bacillithiol biosynthesis cysteine-adding enzyme BshC
VVTTASSHCFENTYAFEIEGLPFRAVPGQSRLFLDYLEDPARLARFYPEAVTSHVRIAERIPSVLASHTVDRGELCDALEEFNVLIGAGEPAIANIGLLRDPECVAVVSGQQAGLFTGPLYTVYKALSAVRLAQCLRDRGYKAVPVFWIATEDHDFEEVSRTFVPDRNGETVAVVNRPAESDLRLPVGRVSLDGSIRASVDEFLANLPPTEHSSAIRAAVEAAYREGAGFGDAFARLAAYLFKDFGLIFLCPMKERLKRLAAPVYVDAARRSAEIVGALKQRNMELERDGYHAQVHIADDYFPLFWQGDDGARNGLRLTEAGTVATKDHAHEFTLDRLCDMVAAEPERFSPSVVLRSVVQDYLLPTVAYFGGAAEVAYFAQSAEVYRVLGRPVTPIIHRQSFTVVEPRHRKALTRYGLSLERLFEGLDKLLPEIVEAHLNSDAGGVFEDVEANIGRELDRLSAALRDVDNTLAENLVKRRRKIVYHLEALRHRFHSAQMRKDEAVRKQIEGMFAGLLPDRHLQERSTNVLYFVNRYGKGFIDWVYEAIDLDDADHRILYL